MRKTAVAALLGTLLAGWAWAAFLPVPPPPGPDVYVHDLAGALDEEFEDEVAAPAADAWIFHQVPIQVVVVERSLAYGSTHIEHLAEQWFNEWRLGPFGLEGSEDPGILFLVALEDRKARIELGDSWGQRWDRHARWIMDSVIVPRFKKGDRYGALREGTEELLEMAKAGPESSPPGHAFEDAVNEARVFSLLPPRWFLGVLGLGVALMLAGAVIPAHRGYLVMTGGGLILVAFFSMVLLAFAAIVLMIQPRRHGRWGTTGSTFGGGYSSGFSGGFSGGGFSGGGGATGSW